MKLRRIALENVRSFLDRTELLLDGDISIIIGPNGGGKTNLLDAVNVALRKHLIAALYPRHAPVQGVRDRYEFSHNDALNALVLERHTQGHDRQQLIEVELEVTERDVQNIAQMKADAITLCEAGKGKYFGHTLQQANDWNVRSVQTGQRHTYRIVDGNLQQPAEEPAVLFLRYMNYFEIDGQLRSEYALAPLSTPMIYLPVNRAGNGFQSSVSLHGFKDGEQKRQVDATISRNPSGIAGLAVGRLARKYRRLQEDNNVLASAVFYDDKNLQELTKHLRDLGYEWSLKTLDPDTNEYDIQITKQGSSFLVSAASSGERELLTYLFAIYALNVRDALIIVDEPELHLHPKWQTTLLTLFTRLAETTGNQFLLATHSPTFVSPDSIQYVSRVYSQAQRSHITRLNSNSLPDSRHLFNIVNSHNNERIFFSDKVILVEGVTDRIFFEAVLRHLNKDKAPSNNLEIVSAGGKNFFEAYKKVLDACKVKYALIADRDYVEQVGTPEIRKLFAVDKKAIKDKVVKNVNSRDGATLYADIEQAMQSGNWGTANETWEYIKRFRVKLRDSLSQTEKDQLATFISEARSKGVCILSKGAIEAYLPEKHRAKDVDAVIRLVNEKDFWDELDADVKTEIQEIVASFQ